jgi:hypothetical protein
MNGFGSVYVLAPSICQKCGSVDNFQCDMALPEWASRSTLGKMALITGNNHTLIHILKKLLT